MSQEASFANLASDVMIDIFSRLPVKTIISCKSVCKSWLNLLTSPEFVKCHLSKSKLPGLVFLSYERDRESCNVIEFESCSTITVLNPLDFSGCCRDTCMEIEGSVNGLISCCMRKTHSCSYYVFNPVTREYIELPHPQERGFANDDCYGFGVTKMNGQYKMVKISFDSKDDRLMCEVYTLGTGSWRTVPIAPDVSPLSYFFDHSGAFSNGNLHWLTEDFEGRCWIFCFDLETELFSIFSTPVRNGKLALIASGDCLHLIEDKVEHEAIVVWSMKEYGVDGSWTKECVISTIWNLDRQSYTYYNVINVFSNGDVLIELSSQHFLYYSSKNNTVRVMCISELPRLSSYYIRMLHSPSFLSLKSFATEDVKLF